jgi:hypothetical protein
MLLLQSSAEYPVSRYTFIISFILLIQKSHRLLSDITHTDRDRMRMKARNFTLLYICQCGAAKSHHDRVARVVRRAWKRRGVDEDNRDVIYATAHAFLH